MRGPAVSTVFIPSGSGRREGGRRIADCPTPHPSRATARSTFSHKGRRDPDCNLPALPDPAVSTFLSPSGRGPGKAGVRGCTLCPPMDPSSVSRQRASHLLPQGERGSRLPRLAQAETGGDRGGRRLRLAETEAAAPWPSPPVGEGGRRPDEGSLSQHSDPQTPQSAPSSPPRGEVPAKPGVRGLCREFQ